jgi:hypothetical protein
MAAVANRPFSPSPLWRSTTRGSTHPLSLICRAMYSVVWPLYRACHAAERHSENVSTLRHTDDPHLHAMPACRLPSVSVSA